MAERLEALVDELQRAAADGNAIPDAELLGRFLHGHDPAALELVVWRHGAMVQSVCRRVLGRCTEVDDAFQATFLVLLRQARSIRRRQSLAGWLHRVALRVAQRTQRMMLSRRRRESAAARLEALDPPPNDEFDLGPLLHAEIDRLPDRLRVAVVLCHLEGKTNEEAARLLGVPHGTILSRLHRARERLRYRLTRRGVALGVVTAGLVPLPEPVAAALVDSVLQGAMNFVTGTGHGPAAILAQGVIQTMFLRKLTFVATGVLAASVMLGAAMGVRTGLLGPDRADERRLAARPVERPADEPKPPPDAPRPLGNESPLDLLVPRKPLRTFHEDQAKILGAWHVAEVLADGEMRDPQGMIIGIGPFGTIMLLEEDSPKDGRPMKYAMEPTASPAGIDLIVGAKKQPGIYRIDGETMRLCLNLKDGARPIEFSGKAGTGQVLFSLKRGAYSVETRWADGLFVKGRQHDFGKIDREEAKTARFTIKNVYDRPIGILGTSITSMTHEGAGGAGGGPAGGLGGAGVGPMGPGGFRAPSWATATEVPAGWLQPGEVAELVFAANSPQLLNLAPGSAELKIAVSFQVKGLERPNPAVGSAGKRGGFDPNAGERAGFGNRRGTDIITSTAELTLTAKTGD